MFGGQTCAYLPCLSLFIAIHEHCQLEHCYQSLWKTFILPARLRGVGCFCLKFSLD
ncbi:hypothetical protein BAE44_0016617 [Dichanthelium oligosanthes]|uniref:Uncharacterized protein n=1 Tax=Dichanthelium oligosanthes TaxID=888268 RepID=A0A1E5VB52_9POAL|nr:hypothetical protein BAE44_0016617 [Dichanthelium oligosanthes]